MDYRFTAVLEKDEDGWFARVPELEGCYTQGDRYEEVMENLRDAVKLHLEDRQAAGESVTKMESISLITLEVAI